MPLTKVLFYQEKEGKAPVLEWLMKLRNENRKGWANCLARVKQLADVGHELRRPAADYLRDDIRELRGKFGHVQYRILYFFHGRNVAVLAHSIIKEGDIVPHIDIERAIERKRIFESNPEAHSYEGEIET
jgi:phage-related protein